jgi:hypothetical protein
LLSPALSKRFSAGLSTGCSGGRDAPTSGITSCLGRHTTSSCPGVSVRTVLGTFPLAHVWTSVGRTWLPLVSHYSFGWVSCFPRCHPAYSLDAYCMGRPPTQPSLTSLLLRFVSSFLAPRCTLALVMCLVLAMVPGYPASDWVGTEPKAPVRVRNRQATRPGDSWQANPGPLPVNLRDLPGCTKPSGSNLQFCISHITFMVAFKYATDNCKRLTLVHHGLSSIHGQPE